MNFQAMNKQRMFILLASVTGIIAMFLPWVDVSFDNYNGMHDEGFAVFACFLLSAVISLIGDKTIYLNRAPWLIILIIGVIATLMIVIFFFNRMNAVVNIFSYGFYLASLAAIGIFAAAYIFKGPGQDHKK